MPLIRGIVLMIIGILAFSSPGTWVIFAGAYMLVDGMAMLFSGFGDQPPGQSRWPLIIVGALGLVAGLIILWNPVVAGVTLTWVIAIWAVVGGIFQIISAIAPRNEIDNECWLILTGILSIIFAIVAGVFSIALAFRVRGFGKEIGAVT